MCESVGATVAVATSVMAVVDHVCVCARATWSLMCDITAVADVSDSSTDV